MPEPDDGHLLPGVRVALERDRLMAVCGRPKVMSASMAASSPRTQILGTVQKRA